MCQCGCGEETPLAPRTRKSRGWIKGQPRPLRPGHSPVRAPATLDANSTAEDITAANIGDSRTIAVTDEWLISQGITVPDDGKRWVYATIEQQSHGSRRHWLRVVPDKSATGPDWPVIHQPDPIEVKVEPLKPVALDGWQRAFIFPDTQIGYRQLRDQTTGELYLDPFHDEAAIACALAAMRAARPHVVVFLGDCLDLPAQSRYLQEPSWAATTQDALNRFYRLLAEVRATLPEARIVVLEGNHDLRLPKSIMTNAAWAFGLTRAGIPAEWPVLSVPHLCRFDELSVEYAAGYPANTFWLSESLACVHGHLVGNATKSSASRVVEDERVSVIFGHVHSIEMRQKTRRVHGGRRTSFAASPGCLCRIDGSVPSVKGGIDPWGRPLKSVEDWQQGAAVVTYQPDGDRHNYEQLSVYEGWTVYRDQFFEAA